ESDPRRLICTLASSLRLNPVRRLGHDLGHQAHAELDRCREAEAACFQGGGGVFGLVYPHLLKNGPGLLVARWNLREMLVEVLADLVFGGGNKTQANTVADQSCGSANAK